MPKQPKIKEKFHRMAIFDFWISTAMLFLLYYIVYISSSELGADVELPANLTRTSLKARAFTPSLDLSCHNVQVDLFSTRQAITGSLWGMRSVLEILIHLKQVLRRAKGATWSDEQTDRWTDGNRESLKPTSSLTLSHTAYVLTTMYICYNSQLSAPQSTLFSLLKIFSVEKKQQQTLKLCKEKRS